MKARPQRPLPTVAHPFRRPIDVRRLPDATTRQTIEASEAECAGLATSIGLPAVKALAARFDLRRRAGGRVTVAGRVEADVMQICVVTLEAFDSRIVQDVDLVFASASVEQAGDRRRRPEEIEVTARTVAGSDDQADPPDAIVDDTIDLGVVATEFLALALDPYPRRSGVSFDDVVEAADEEEPSAFAALERLKARP